MKKKALLILVILSLLIPSISSASRPLDIHYFGIDACISCAKAVRYLEDVVSGNSTWNLIKHDTMIKEDEELLVKYNNHYGVTGDKYKIIPAVFVGDRAFIEDEIEDELLDYLDEYSGENTIDLRDSGSSSDIGIALDMSLIGIFLAGLLDGINPCSIAMMLFFISFVFSIKGRDTKKDILTVSLGFVIGTFLAYLGIGIGLFRFMYSFKGIYAAMRLMYILLGGMGAYLCYINLMDYINIKRGREEKIKNQLNKKTKKLIHKTIKRMNASTNTMFITSFITAFLISFMEFFCTGQIYVPVITYLISNEGLSAGYIGLLIVYNIAFVIPLSLIAGFIYMGKSVIDVSSILVNRLHIIKLAGAVFFAFVVIYSLTQVVLM